MTKAFRSFSVVLFLSISNIISAQSLIGSWQNELGSVLKVDSISANGFIFGAYHSSSGVDGKIFPLQGWMNKSEDDLSLAVAFTVRWDGYGSITSWSGYYVDGDEAQPFIKTLWHLVRPGEKEQWERIITNSSTFVLMRE